MKVAAFDCAPAELAELLPVLRECGVTIAGTMDSPRFSAPTLRFLIGGDLLPARCEKGLYLVRFSTTKRPGHVSLIPEIIGEIEAPARAA